MVKEDKKPSFKKHLGLITRCLIGFAFAIWAIYASGAEIVMYGFILILLGVPIYGYMSIKKHFR